MLLDRDGVSSCGVHQTDTTLCFYQTPIPLRFPREIVMIIIFIGVLAVAGALWIYKHKFREQNLPRYGAYNIELAQSSTQQKVLQDLGGGKRYDGVYVKTLAQLVVEDAKPGKVFAVRVEISGKTVGYLSATNAQQFHKFLKSGGTCPAVIVGGWQRDREQGDFSVKLDLDLK